MSIVAPVGIHVYVLLLVPYVAFVPTHLEGEEMAEPFWKYT